MQISFKKVLIYNHYFVHNNPCINVHNLVILGMNKNTKENTMTNLFHQLMNIDKDTFKDENEKTELYFKGIFFHADMNENVRAEKITHVRACFRGDYIPILKRINFEDCNLVEVNGTNSAIYKGEKNYYWDFKKNEEYKSSKNPECDPRLAGLINEFNSLIYNKLWMSKKSAQLNYQYSDFYNEFKKKHYEVLDKERESWIFSKNTGAEFRHGFTFKHDKFLTKFNEKLDQQQITKEKLEQKKRQRELEKARVSDKVECPVCHGYAEWEKIHGEKVVYDHGFTVGYGHRNNPCFGSRYNCWEKSPKGKQDFLDQILRYRFKFIMRNQPTQERLNEINSKVVEVDQKIKELDANKTIELKDKRYQLSFLQYEYPTFIGYRLQVQLDMVLLTKLWTDAKNKTKEDILATINMLRDWKEQPTLNERKAEIQESMEISKPKKRKLTGAEMRRAFFG